MLISRAAMGGAAGIQATADGAASYCRLARCTLVELGLLQSECQRAGGTHEWCIPQLARAAAASLLAQARTAGALSAAEAQPAAPTPRQKEHAGKPGSKQKQQGKRRQPAAGGAELVGRNVFVYWDDGFVAYRGTIRSFDPATGWVSRMLSAHCRLRVAACAV